jgi:hypothetical protein
MNKQLKFIIWFTICLSVINIHIVGVFSQESARIQEFSQEKARIELMYIGASLHYVEDNTKNPLDKITFGDCTGLNNDNIKYLGAYPDLRSLDIFYSTNIKSYISDSGLVYLKRLSKLQSLRIRNANITTSGLVNLKGLIQLEELDLSGNNIAGEGLKYLEGLNNLKTLELGGCGLANADLIYIKNINKLQILFLGYNFNITDDGLDIIKGMRSLKELNLYSDNKITDAGLEKLQALTQLEILIFGGVNNQVKFTKDGVERLQKALPKTKIHAERVALR